MLGRPVAISFTLALLLTPVARAQVRRIGDMNTRQIQALDRSKTVVFLTGGILEEHGPFLPAYTDGVLSERLTQEVAQAVVRANPGWTALLLPQIPLGASGSNELGGHFVFPGTYAIRPSTLRAVFMDLATELGEQGFRKIVVVHVHGAPMHNRALDEASDFFRDTYGGRMVHVWGLVRVLGGWGQALQGLTDSQKQEDGVSLHGGLDETSLMLYLQPGLVSPAYKTAPVITGKTLDESFAVARGKDWPGYLGSPRLASDTLGARIWKSFAAAAASYTLSWMAGTDTAEQRYADLLEGNALYKGWFDAATARDAELQTKQEAWLRRRKP